MTFGSGKQGSRQPDGTQGIRLEADAGTLEFVLEKTVIETRVMRHQQLAVEALRQCLGHFAKTRLMAHHMVADARQVFNGGRN